MIYLIADTHFGHEREIEFGRPHGYEQKILTSLSKILSDGDVLIHLGDFCIGKDEFWHQEFVGNLIGIKRILVRGNHDKKSDSWYYDHGWHFVCRSFSNTTHGKRIIFTHIPCLYDPDEFDCNIHGHLHDNRHRGSPEDFIFQDGVTRTMKLISMEHSNYQPISLKSIL